MIIENALKKFCNINNDAIYDLHEKIIKLVEENNSIIKSCEIRNDSQLIYNIVVTKSKTIEFGISVPQKFNELDVLSGLLVEK